MLTYPDIDPVALQLGPLAIRWYGLSYIVGIGFAWWLLDRRARISGSRWTPAQVSDVVFYSALGGILGGRIGYILFYNLAAYAESPLSVFKVWEGGMSFHGGVLGGIVAIWLYARACGRSFFSATDFVVPAVPMALLWGRLGNFANGELWGKPTDLPWGMVFPDPLAGGVPRHPTQLYEAALEGLLLFLLLWYYSRVPRPVRAVSGLFLLGYGLFRFPVEFLRIPDAQLGYLAFDWLTMGQVLTLPMILFGLVLMLTSGGSAAAADAPIGGRRS